MSDPADVSVTAADGGAFRPAPVAIIGAGAVGSALARGLEAAGYSIEAVISRTGRSARRLASETGAPVASSSLEDLPAATVLLFCCVPDDQIRPVAEALASLPQPWPARLVAHTSGACTTDALAPLAAAGATVLSFHPMQAFTEKAPPEAFEGIYVGLEGEEEARVAGRDLAAALGAHTVALPREAKTRYHLAASMASNFAVTLVALASDVLADAGVDPDEAGALLHPLVQGTLRNLGSASPHEALTGPIPRGDTGTVARHLEALRTHHPDLLPAYAALATETVHLAVRAGRLSGPAADHLLQQFEAALEPRSESPS